MRSMVWRMESIWSWFASFSVAERPAVLAEVVRRPWSSVRSEETSCRPPSAMFMTWSARSALPMAAVRADFSARRFSLAIRPAGSSLPRLIFRPVERRSSETLSDWLLAPSTRWPMSDETLVLMRDIGWCPPCKLGRSLSLDCRPWGSAAPVSVPVLNGRATRPPQGVRSTLAGGG